MSYIEIKNKTTLYTAMLSMEYIYMGHSTELVQSVVPQQEKLFTKQLSIQT